ncbi:hypothetical protein C6496_00165 [Candidatus Poribacteria bacterium]|nr:MAG: hypothetical protein C6496_00165 [Candidatus Poribacteria bacterium]
MKLLFDQNLSPNLVNLLAALFPNSAHVQDAGLDASEDTELWDYARNNDYLIVSKDADFRHRSIVYGPPPKIIWLGLGNCSTRTVEDNLRDHYSDIQTFARDTNRGLFVLL